MTSQAVSGSVAGSAWSPPPAPPPQAHLRRLTSDLGMWQHTLGTAPNPEHGFCLDDAARAWLVCLGWPREEAGPPDATPYRSLLERAQLPDGGVHNFADAAGRWLDRRASGDAHGRAAWAWGVAAAAGDEASERRLRAVMPHLLASRWPHTWAYGLLGLCSLAEAGDRRETWYREGVAGLGERLEDAFRRHRGARWQWCAPAVTYAAGRLPQALALAGATLARRDWVERAAEALAWYIDHTSRPTLEDSEGVTPTPGAVYWPVGQAGWWPRGQEPARWDQQPVEAGSLTEACLSLERVGAGSCWRERADWAWSWFEGANALGARVLDDESGGCHDGLQPQGLNRNRGAESLLVALLAHLALGAARRHHGQRE